MFSVLGFKVPIVDLNFEGCKLMLESDLPNVKDKFDSFSCSCSAINGISFSSNEKQEQKSSKDYPTINIPFIPKDMFFFRYGAFGAVNVVDVDENKHSIAALDGITEGLKLHFGVVLGMSCVLLNTKFLQNDCYLSVDCFVKKSFMFLKNPYGFESIGSGNVISLALRIRVFKFTIGFVKSVFIAGKYFDHKLALKHTQDCLSVFSKGQKALISNNDFVIPYRSVIFGLCI